MQHTAIDCCWLFWGALQEIAVVFYCSPGQVIS